MEKYKVKNIKKILEKVEDKMNSVAVCVPILPPLGTSVEFHNTLMEIFNTIDKYLNEINLYDEDVEMGSSVYDTVINLENMINILYTAATQNNVLRVQREFDALQSENAKEQIIFEKKNHIYSSFISNLVVKGS